MQTRKGRGLPDPVESREPPLGSSRKPGWRTRFILMIERFGFLMIGVLTIIALAVFFIATEGIKGKPDWALGRAEAHEQGLLGEGGAMPTGDVTLSISTSPVGAAIYVDGDYAGVSPLRGLVVEQGRRLISVHKPDYAQLDTFLTFNEAAVSLKFSLQNGDVILVHASEPWPQETRSASSSQARPTQPPASPAAERRAEAEEKPVVQTGELHIVSEPAGASVLMAGQAVGVTPLVLSAVEAGEQQITLRLDGYEAFTTTVAVAAQQRSTVTGQLTQQAGTLKVLAKPWGSIYIDGELRKDEASAWYITKLTPGFHRLRVQHPSLGTWEQVIDVAAGGEHPITIDFNKDS